VDAACLQDPPNQYTNNGGDFKQGDERTVQPPPQSENEHAVRPFD
jgi:hypothetical protein